MTGEALPARREAPPSVPSPRSPAQRQQGSTQAPRASVRLEASSGRPPAACRGRARRPRGRATSSPRSAATPPPAILPRRDDNDGESSRPCLGRDLDGHRRQPVGAEDHHDVGRPELEVREDYLSEALHTLDEHRLTLAVGADDLGVVRHRELDHRVEPGIGAVARNISSTGCASARCRTRCTSPPPPIASAQSRLAVSQQLGLRLRELGEKLLRRFEPSRCRCPGHDRSAQALG